MMPADSFWQSTSFTFFSTELLVVMEGIELIFLETENSDLQQSKLSLSPG